MEISLTPNHIKRLSFIKYLFQSAQEQAQYSEPLCYSAILNLHDSVELFLVLGCTLHSVGNLKNMGFMQYFDALHKKKGIGELSQKQTLQKLNAIRRELKHRGSFPNKLELEEQVISCRIFFEENTYKIFDIDFKGISLVDFVENDEVKEHLINAEKFIEKKKKDEAINEIAKAFYQLIKDFRNSTRYGYGTSYLSLNSRNRPRISQIRSLRRDMSNKYSEVVHMFSQQFEKLDKYLKDLEEHVELIGIGIDLKKLGKFKLSTPEVYTDGNGSLQILRHSQRPLIDSTNEDLEFCFNFVIETSLHFSEFKFELDDLEK